MNIGTQHPLVTRWSSYSASRSGQNMPAFFDVPMQTGQTKPVEGRERDSKGGSLLAQPLFNHHHGNTITLEDLKAEAQDSQETFQTNFLKTLADAGIVVSQPIVLQSDAQGNVHVANDVPNKTAIGKMLQDNPELTNEYHRAEANASIAAAAEEAKAFQAAYARSPQAAIAQYDHLFDNKEDVFYMTI